MNYKLSPEAETDLIHIHQWGVRRFGERQADTYFFDLIEQCERIAENPLHYPKADKFREGYRLCVFSKRDSIFYRIVDGQVEIMAIIGQQDFKNWL